MSEVEVAIDALRAGGLAVIPTDTVYGLAADARGATEVLANGGALVLEVGDGQAEATAALLVSLAFADVRATPDLAGRDRVVEGRR